MKSPTKDSLIAPAASPELDSVQLRRVMSNFPSGVVVLTAINRSEPVGMTVQSFASLSLQPPLCLVCPSKSSTSWPRILEAPGLVVNILGAQQGELAKQFGSRGADKFSGVRWDASPILGAPVLNDVVAWLECQVCATYDGGDHTIQIASILGATITDTDDPDPLVYFRTKFGTFA